MPNLADIIKEKIQDSIQEGCDTARLKSPGEAVVDANRKLLNNKEHQKRVNLASVLSKVRDDMWKKKSEEEQEKKDQK